MRSVLPPLEGCPARRVWCIARPGHQQLAKQRTSSTTPADFGCRGSEALPWSERGWAGTNAQAPMCSSGQEPTVAPQEPEVLNCSCVWQEWESPTISVSVPFFWTSLAWFHNQTPYSLQGPYNGATNGILEFRGAPGQSQESGRGSENAWREGRGTWGSWPECGSLFLKGSAGPGWCQAPHWDLEIVKEHTSKWRGSWGSWPERGAWLSQV